MGDWGNYEAVEAKQIVHGQGKLYFLLEIEYEVWTSRDKIGVIE